MQEPLSYMVSEATLHYKVVKRKAQRSTGFYVMETLLKIFKKKELVSTLTEQYCFKFNFKRYYANSMSDGSLVFKCYSTRLEKEWGAEMEYDLGRVVGGQLHKPSNFYSYPWDVQKGARRLWRLVYEDVLTY